AMAEKVLVVDDVPVNVKLLADLLAVKGYAVVTAASGAEALEQIEKEQPGLVLLDAMMPGMSGYDVCRRIRQNAATAMLPVSVVFLDLRGFTAFAETSEPEEVMGVLREYHVAMGRIILEHEGTLERFTGDGMMIFFNDPVPVPDAPERAVRMAVAMRERVDEL